MFSKIDPQLVDKVKNIISEKYDDIFEIFKQLNQHPELLFDLPITVNIAKEALRKVNGLVIQDVIGAPSCFVGIIENGEGPTIAYRTDMDNLPVPDLTNNPWKSLDPTRSASCGHTTHLATAILICHVMSALGSQWKGRLLVYFQASEEGGTMELGSGAQCMLRNGLYTSFGVPEAVLAIHCDPFRPANMVRLKKGVAFAHTSLFEMKIWGEAAHGGMPFKGIDTILLAARCIEALQGIVSRELNPRTEPAVLTIGSFQAGQAANAVPAVALLSGTIRCFSEAVYEKIQAAMKRTIEGQAAAMGVPQKKWPIIDFYPVFAPQLINDESLGDQLEAVYRTVLPKNNCIELSNDPEFYGEDFANYGLTPEQVPIFLTWVGSVDPNKFNTDGTQKEELPSLHDGRYSPFWDKNADTDTLRTAVLTQSSALLNLLMPK
jgi:amidohydrolase